MHFSAFCLQCLNLCVRSWLLNLKKMFFCWHFSIILLCCHCPLAKTLLILCSLMPVFLFTFAIASVKSFIYFYVYIFNFLIAPVADFQILSANLLYPALFQELLAKLSNMIFTKSSPFLQLSQTFIGNPPSNPIEVIELNDYIE